MKAVIGGGIALVLLGLYGYSVLEAIRIAMSEGLELKSGFVNTMNTVGGLVSALVISELAITRPGAMPAARIAGGDGTTSGWAQWVVLSYIAAWALLGLAAYVYGVMLHEGVVPALTDFGAAWLGLAVASGYAYFGLGRTESAPAPGD
jgi:hypothetical protein